MRIYKLSSGGKKVKMKKPYKAPKIRSEKIQVGVFGDYEYEKVEDGTKFITHTLEKNLC